MDITEKEISFTYKGIMKKPIIGMTEIERAEYYKKSFKEIKQNIFENGQPLVYEKNGNIIAEYFNGRIDNIKNA
jgi:hypothetical protein